MLDETTLEKRAEQIGEVCECMIGPQHLKMLAEIKTLVFWHDNGDEARLAFGRLLQLSDRRHKIVVGVGGGCRDRQQDEAA